jgi:hypothetical protein
MDTGWVLMGLMVVIAIYAGILNALIISMRNKIKEIEKKINGG